MLCDSCQGQYTEMLLIEELVAKSYEDEKEDE